MYKTGKNKYDIFKSYYYEDATKVGKYELPLLKPVKFIPKEVISFNEKNKLKENDDRWLDFFIDDVLFESVWTNADRYEKIFKRAKGIITTDYSVYPELLFGQRIWNITRNRSIAYHLQEHMKLDIIPVVSWCNSKDFEWCFDGIPEDSSVAVSTNGCKSEPYSKRIFLEGIEAAQEIIKPFKIIICGSGFDELNKYNNIHYYKNFSQRRRMERRKK